MGHYAVVARRYLYPAHVQWYVCLHARNSLGSSIHRVGILPDFHRHTKKLHLRIWVLLRSFQCVLVGFLRLVYAAFRLPPTSSDWRGICFNVRGIMD